MKTIVVFNLRGGIGKTTVSVALAESLASFHGLNVLIADADSQRNASLRLCPTALVDECSKPGSVKNISVYLSHAVNKNSLPERPAAYVTERCGTVHGAGRVDMLMGSTDTYNADQHFTGLITTKSSRFVISKLSEAFRHVATDSDYDVMIVDCPPHLSSLVRGALAMADLWLVPMVAQSTAELLYGSAQQHIATQLRNAGATTPPTIFVATMYETSSRTFFERLREKFHSHLKIKKQKSFGLVEMFSPEHGSTIKEKYGSAEKDLKEIATAVVKRLGLPQRVRKPKTREAAHVRKSRGSSASASART